MNALTAAVDGFLLGAGLIIAIGAQNAFVLKQGLKREFVFTICLICSLSDALLIAAGVGGLGRLVNQSQDLLTAMTAAGAIFLIVYGARAFVRAVRPGTLQAAGGEAGGLAAAVAACLAFTFLNTHVYIDTVLLLGGLSGRYHGAARIAYGVGAAIASTSWFFVLGYGARLIAPLFAKESAWRVLDIAVGVVMWWIAAGLVWSLVA